MSLRQLVWSLVALTAACSAESGDGRPHASRDGGGTPVENTRALCVDGLDGDRDGLTDCADPDCAAFCASVDAGARDAGFLECDELVRAAEEQLMPVDIVWIVDSSGSMENEAEVVQDNLNQFSRDISMAGIDVHVVVITSRAFVNVPEPLASSPNYRLLDRDVNSSESLQALLAEFPRYSDFLRRQSNLHFIVTTDDESAITAGAFRDEMRTKLEGKPFVFHAIASERVAPGFGNPNGACQRSSGFPPEGAAAPGERYYELARLTGGQIFSICTDDWAGLFRTLTSVIAVPRPLPCTYAIPAPPVGMSFDRTKVNVLFTPGGATSPERIGFVGTSDGPRCTEAGGWYYDVHDAPTSILLCPALCDRVEGDSAATMAIALGCESLLI